VKKSTIVMLPYLESAGSQFRRSKLVHFGVISSGAYENGLVLCWIEAQRSLHGKSSCGSANSLDKWLRRISKYGLDIK
jgi:hypothetical protein